MLRRPERTDNRVRPLLEHIRPDRESMRMAGDEPYHDVYALTYPRFRLG